MAEVQGDLDQQIGALEAQKEINNSSIATFQDRIDQLEAQNSIIDDGIANLNSLRPTEENQNV